METRKVREDGPSTSIASANDVKFEMMLKKIEKLMDKLAVDNRLMNREQNEPQIRKPNFKRPNPLQPLQIRQRDSRNPRNSNDQKIQPPFTENYVDDKGGEEPPEDQIHHFGDLDYDIYLTEMEHNLYAQEEDPKDLEEELEQYQRGYMHAIDEVKRKIQLRSRDVTFNRGKQNPNEPYTSL